MDAHGFEFCGEAVGVPAEAAFDAAAAHGVVARDDVFGVPGEEVAVVREAVGEGWAVVEHEFVAAVGAGFALVDAFDEGGVFGPVV